MIFDEKRDIIKWHQVGSGSKELGPGTYTSTVNNSGAKSSIGVV